MLCLDLESYPANNVGTDAVATVAIDGDILSVELGHHNGNNLVGFSKNGIKAGSPVGLVGHAKRRRGKGLAGAISTQTKWRLLISIQSHAVGFGFGTTGNPAGNQQQDNNAAQFSLIKREPNDDATGFSAGTHRRHGVGTTK